MTTFCRTFPKVFVVHKINKKLFQDNSDHLLKQLRELTTIRDEIVTFKHSKMTSLTNLGEKLVKKYNISCQNPLSEVVRRQKECLEVYLITLINFIKNK